MTVSKLRLLLLGIVLPLASVFADVGDEIPLATPPPSFDDNQASPSDMGPFFIKVNYDDVMRAKFDKRPFNHQHLKFAELNVEAIGIFCYNPSYEEGLGASFNYCLDQIRWKHNPYYKQEYFNTVSFGILGFTHRMCDWDLKASAQVNFDPEHLNFQDYVNYNLLLQSRYAFCGNWGLNLGFLALTGMKIDRFYPIVGVDWRINDKWKINAIYPLDFSINYLYNCNWTLTVGSRFWDNRHRFAKSAELSMGLIEYRNYGAEFRVSYNRNSKILANVHAGYTTGAKLRISDRHHQHTHRIKFNGAPYVGAEASVNF